MGFLDIFPNKKDSNLSEKPARERLNELVGLEDIKEKISRYVTECKISRMSSFSCMRRNIALIGNSETEINTVARILSDILHEEKICNGNFVNVTPSDLFGQFEGETSTKRRNVFEEACGGVLFIDKAYELELNKDALESILTHMTSTEDSSPIVILAGYPDEMNQLFEATPGLQSRVSNIWNFPDVVDHKNEELTENDSIKKEEAPVETETQELEEPKDEVPTIDNTEVLEQIANVEEKVEGLKDSLENVLLNVQQLVRNQASANDVAAMRRENEAFRSDSNMKLMRAYGIDAMIKTYQGICEKIFRLNHPGEEDSIADVAGEKKAYEWVLKTMGRQFKRLGIRLQTSEMGDEVNEEFMTVYGSEGEDVEETLTMVQTDNEALKDTVKESVSPAFVWTIPSLIGEKKEWVMEPEKICMYK